MYRLIIALTFFISINLVSAQKEEVFLFYDGDSNTKCILDIEGKGLTERNYYLKESNKNFIDFHFCKQTFRFKKGDKSKVIKLKDLRKINISSIKFFEKEVNKNLLPINPFKKTYIIEKSSPNEYCMYEVIWLNNLTVVE